MSRKIFEDDDDLVIEPPSEKKEEKKTTKFDKNKKCRFCRAGQNRQKICAKSRKNGTSRRSI